MIEGNVNLFSLFLLGGWAMFPLLLLSILVIGISIERFFYFIRHNFRFDGVESHLLDPIRQGKIEQLEEYLDSTAKNQTTLSLFRKSMKYRHLGTIQMEKILEAETTYQVKQMENGLNFLSQISSLAPIIGFLGTVSGMIAAFYSISRSTDVNAQLVAGGIFEALITTAFGLILAVIATLAYYFFSRKIEYFITQMEYLATHFLIDYQQYLSNQDEISYENPSDR